MREIRLTVIVFMKIKILLADENQLFRELMSERFSRTDDIEVVAETGDGLEILEKVNYIQTDIVLTEVISHRLNGIEVTKSLQRNNPSIKVVALTNLLEKNFIKSMLEANAWGYLMKNNSFGHISDCIRQIHSGSKRLSPVVQSILIDDYLDRNGKIDYTPLTMRESEILTMLAEGKSIKEISETYFISIKTAGTHKQNIFEKMGFENLAQLVRYALINGIVS